MKKYNVHYSGGMSRVNPGVAIDYMLAVIPDADDGEDIELYAEAINSTWDDEAEAFADETATYDELREAILGQAQEQGVDPAALHFLYDEQSSV